MVALALLVGVALMGSAIADPTGQQVATPQAPSKYEFQHSLKRPFFKPERGIVPFWTMGESAALTEQSIRLVPSVSSRKGWVWNKTPLELDDWEVRVEFAIYGRAKMGADGLAIWYTQEREQTGPVYGSLDKWHGLGIMVDTYDNDGKGDNPIILGVLNNGDTSYSVGTDGKGQSFGSCHAPFKGAPSLRNALNPSVLKITYKDKKLTVAYDMAKSGVFTECFSKDNVDLPKGYYLGASAETGGLADDHDLFKFETWNMSPKKKGEEVHAEVKIDDHWQFDPEEEARLKAEYERQIQELEEARRKWESENPGQPFDETAFIYGDMAGEGQGDAWNVYTMQQLVDAQGALRDIVDLNFQSLNRRLDEMQRSAHARAPPTGADPQLMGRIDSLINHLRTFEEKLASLEGRVVQQQHIAKEDIKRTLKEETSKLTENVEQGGSYTFWVVVGLVMAQMGLGIMYVLYKRATDDSSKKFI